MKAASQPIRVKFDPNQKYITKTIYKKNYQRKSLQHNQIRTQNKNNNARTKAHQTNLLEPRN